MNPDQFPYLEVTVVADGAGAQLAGGEVGTVEGRGGPGRTALVEGLLPDGVADLDLIKGGAVAASLRTAAGPCPPSLIR